MAIVLRDFFRLEQPKEMRSTFPVHKDLSLKPRNFKIRFNSYMEMWV